jgi:hypothetical protein
MELFEEIVMWHLTRSGRVFLCPQYSVGGGWACPDFVALNYAKKTVQVVEVSAANWPGGLLRRVLDRENQWFAKLRTELQEKGIIDGSWKTFEVVLYLRRSAAQKFRDRIAGAEGVVIHIFEDIGFPWEWDWPSAKAEKEAQEGRE